MSEIGVPSVSWGFDRDAMPSSLSGGAGKRHSIPFPRYGADLLLKMPNTASSRAIRDRAQDLAIAPIWTRDATEIGRNLSCECLYLHLREHPDEQDQGTVEPFALGERYVTAGQPETFGEVLAKENSPQCFCNSRVAGIARCHEALGDNL
jgi:hypothetical protein